MTTHRTSHRLPALLATTVLLTAVVGGGTLAASAATPATRSATPAHNTVVLNYWDMQWSGPTVKQLQANVNTFNRTHPGIHVVFRQLSWGDYTQKLLSAVQAGAPPDLSGGDSGIPFTMGAQGQTFPINDLFAQWQRNGTFKDMVPWAYKKWEYQGKDYGITWQFDGRGIFYRKDLFQNAGIPVPTTWQQWLAAAKKLTNLSKGIYGIAVPGKQGTYDTDQFYMTLVFQAGGGLADVNGNPTFKTPQQLKALEFEKELVACCAAKGTPAWTFTEVEKAFEQGKAAMAFGGGWFINDIKTTAPQLFQNIGVLPVLIGPGGPRAQHSVAFANPWMIYKQTKHPKEARIFLMWMMQPDNVRKVYASGPGSYWPVYTSLLSDSIYRANEVIHTFATEVAEHGVDYWYPNNKAAVGIASLGTGIADYIVNPVITGSRTPQQALQDAQSKLAPLFQKQK